MNNKIKEIADDIINIHNINNICKREFDIVVSFVSRCVWTIISLKNTDLTKIKIKLFELIRLLRERYEKSTGSQAYEKLINKINSEFPVRPFDWEEFEFERLMESAFLDNKKNKLKFTDVLYSSLFNNKNYKNIKKY